MGVFPLSFFRVAVTVQVTDTSSRLWRDWLRVCSVERMAPLGSVQDQERSYSFVTSTPLRTTEAGGAERVMV